MDPSFTRSELEERVLALVDRHGLPRPELNVDLLGFEVDALWRGERLVAELDRFRTHGTRARFVSDRRRDRRLAAAGYRVIRFTWAEVADTPSAIASEIRTLLGLPTLRRAR